MITLAETATYTKVTVVGVGFPERSSMSKPYQRGQIVTEASPLIMKWQGGKVAAQGNTLQGGACCLGEWGKVRQGTAV